MIRFPPTSIALSQHDVDLHFQEIYTKYQLYAQGFSRNEVQQYYAERHGDADSSKNADDRLSLRNTQGHPPKLGKEPTYSANTVLEKGKKGTNLNAPLVETTSVIEHGKTPEDPSLAVSDPLSSSPLSVPSSPLLTQIPVPYRHAAVRQSSLLRIMHSAGSQASTASTSSGGSNIRPGEDDDHTAAYAESGDFSPSPATRTRSYRLRSKTYSYIESEADPPTPPLDLSVGRQNTTPPIPALPKLTEPETEPVDRSQSTVQPRLNPHAAPFSPDAIDSSPLNLPPPVAVSRRTSSVRFSLPHRTRWSVPSAIDWHADPNQSSPSLLAASPTSSREPSSDTIANELPRTPSARSTFQGMRVVSSSHEQSSVAAPIASNLPSSPRTHILRREPSSSLLGSLETPIRDPPQTEPQHVFRPDFGVYIDTLPADTQPQTPADLESSQRRAVEQRSIAYTAPPGRIWRATRGIPFGNGNETDDNSTVQSPAVRTNRMRETRAREWGRWRGIWLARQQSTRGRPPHTEHDIDDQDVDVATAIGNGTDGTPTRLRSPRPGPSLDSQTDLERRRTHQHTSLDPDPAGTALPRQWRATTARSTLSRRLRTTAAAATMDVDIDWRDVFDEDRVGEENFESLDVHEQS